jgi:hypothetical protein
LTNGNPNGTWSLYVQDFASGDSGSIVSWSVRIVTTGAVVPSIGISVSGSNYVISGTNGTPGSTNILLTATNIALPVSNWTPLATNLFDSNGSFVFTNSALPWVPQRFYTLLLP